MNRVMDMNIEICKALGLDTARARTVTLRLAPCVAPTVEVEYLVLEHDVLTTQLQTYELKPKEPDAKPPT